MDFDSHVGNGGEMWRGVFGRNSLPDLNLRAALVLDFFTCQCITNNKNHASLRSQLLTLLSYDQIFGHMLDAWVKNSDEPSAGGDQDRVVEENVWQA